MERAQAIFEYASELGPEERERFLLQICDDPALLAQVRLRLEQAQADTVELPSVVIPAASETIKFLFAPGDLIGSRYVVIRAIAKGGMGEVYEVDDFELRSRVALKTISLKSAARPNAFEMFRREILLARQVTHPNVCRIYDLGHHLHAEHGDMLFLTMELLNGQTLAQRIRAQGPMSKEEAFPLLQQMIQALSAAHRLNIAHRDFKSGNVILCAPATPGSGPLATPGSGPAAEAEPITPPAGSTSSSGGGADASGAGGTPDPPQDAAGDRASSTSPKGLVVKVTDFGLARSVDGLETTVHGEVWGTPDYMAPEQFHGQSSIASDIYSLGVVTYEMFTGKLPHRSSSGSITPGAKASAAVEKIPAEWRSVVKKCMAYEPADRYATVDEVWAALNGKEPTQPERRRYVATWAIVLAILLSAAASAWLGRSWMNKFLNILPDQKHIAVLPFESIDKGAGDTAFCAGLGETLTSKLAQLGVNQPIYWVVPYNDSRKYTSIDDARRNLGVTLVITGSVQRTGSDMRITTNLVDANKHRVLASRVMVASIGDLNLLQDQTWESVAEMVDVPLDDDTKRKISEGSTKSARAYDYYEQGIGYLQHRDLANLDNAIAVFQKAAAEDPTYALAQAGLGNAYATKYYVTKDPRWISEAKQYGDKAATLSPNLSAVRETLGKIYENTGKLDEALAEYTHALELNPMAITASLRIAKIYAQQGRYAEAESDYKRSINSAPWYWAGYAGLGSVYFSRGQFSDAATQFQKIIDLMPDNPLGYEDLGAAYTQMGEYQKAIDVFKKGLATKENPELWSDLGAAYMFMGKNMEAVEAMQKAVNLNPHDHKLWRNLGDSYRQVPSLSTHAPEAYQKALQVALEELSVNPADRKALGGAALYEAHLGHRQKAQKFILQALESAHDADSETLFTAALVYEIIGSREEAITELSKAMKAGFSMEDMKREPELLALRSDPRFQQVLRGSSSRSQ
jgi:serine/threonine protein kinase/tetratricopeptide (TPR) repeat protein